MRQIRMLRAMWRGLETGLRRLLHGHARGNPDTAKELPTDNRASSRPYQGGVFFANSKKDYPAAAILNKAIAEQGK